VLACALRTAIRPLTHPRRAGISGLYKRVGGLEQAARDQAAYRDRFGLRDDVFQLMERGHTGYGEAVALDNVHVDAGGSLRVDTPLPASVGGREGGGADAGAGGGGGGGNGK
jgi:hypothetical protein